MGLAIGESLLSAFGSPEGGGRRRTSLIRRVYGVEVEASAKAYQTTDRLEYSAI